MMALTANSSSIIVPEVLKNNNYKIWSACMKDYFSSQGLWELVDGKIAEDTNTDDWKKKNAMALHAIKISCEHKILSHIGLAVRASDAWKQLERIQKKREKGTSDIELHKEKDKDSDQYKEVLSNVQNGKLRKVKAFIEEHPEAVRAKVTSSGGTLLHAAITAKKVEIVESLASKMELQDLKIEDNNLFTALDTIAAQLGDVEIALEMAKSIVSKDPTLVTHGKVLTPILIASAHGHKEMTRYLYNKATAKADEPLTQAQTQAPAELIGAPTPAQAQAQAPALVVGADPTPVVAQTQAPALVVGADPTPAGAQTQAPALVVGADPTPVGAQARAPALVVGANPTPVGAQAQSPVLVVGADPTPVVAQAQSPALVVGAQAQAPAEDNQDRTQINEAQAAAPVEASQDPTQITQAPTQAEAQDNILDSLDPEKGRLHGTILLSHCINGKMFDVASDLLKRFPKLAGKQCAFIDPVQDLCKVPSAFSTGNQGFIGLWKERLFRILKYLGFPVKFEDQKVIHVEAKKFLRSICEKIATFDESELKETSVREAMLEAAKNGVVEFITEMARASTDGLRLFFDDDRRNIFSYAIIYRQEKVFNLIYGLGSKAIDDLTNIVDSYDNNMLHLAAGVPETSSTFHRKSGAALQMQRELQWFKEVERLCRPSCKEMLNQDGLTPRELFTKTHRELVKEGENWMKAAAQSSTVVVALIVTVTFAAVFTVPGGNNQDSGFPIFLSDLVFKIFIVCNGLSFFSSLTSVLMFLEILMSRYAEGDFLKVLPKKLIIGLTSLSVSIASMMGTFCCALTIMQHGRWKIILPVSLLSFFPVAFFFFSSLYPLLSDIFVSTYGRSIFVKDTKFPKKKEDSK